MVAVAVVAAVVAAVAVEGTSVAILVTGVMDDMLVSNGFVDLLLFLFPSPSLGTAEGVSGSAEVVVVVVAVAVAVAVAVEKSKVAAVVEIWCDPNTASCVEGSGGIKGIGVISDVTVSSSPKISFALVGVPSYVVSIPIVDGMEEEGETPEKGSSSLRSSASAG